MNAEEDDAGIAFHSFLEKFSTRMKASPTKLTAREIFEELDGFSGTAAFVGAQGLESAGAVSFAGRHSGRSF